MLDGQPPEFLERHEISPLRTDTFEVAFQVLHHYGDGMHSLGPRVLDEQLRYGAVSPQTRELWEDDFLRCQATVPPCPAMDWNWIVPHALAVEAESCLNEMEWFGRDGARRTVIPFDAYVRDLEGTMRTVYRSCLGAEPSPHVPRTHAARRRSDYSVDRSLTQLGIDVDAFTRPLEAYRRWSRGESAAS